MNKLSIWLNKPFWKFRTGFKFIFWIIMPVAVAIKFLFSGSGYGKVSIAEIIYSVLAIVVFILWIMKKIGKKAYEKSESFKFSNK
jgi:hypothetical protein